MIFMTGQYKATTTGDRGSFIRRLRQAHTVVMHDLSMAVFFWGECQKSFHAGNATTPPRCMHQEAQLRFTAPKTDMRSLAQCSRSYLEELLHTMKT